MLFVARRAPTDPLDVWELALDGGAPRRITDRPTSCTQAIYAASLYTLDAAEPVDQIVFSSAADRDGGSASGRAALYRSRMDGSGVRRITFDPYGASDPLLLVDGRLLYASSRPPEGGGGTALFTMHTDGTDVFVFADAHDPAAGRGMPCETDDGRVVYVESAGHDPLGGGALVSVARARSLHSREVIATAALGTYHSPSALADGSLLVAYRDGSGGSYGIYVLDPRTGARIRTVFDSPDRDDVDAVEVRPRRASAGRSSVVDERVDFGWLYCLNVYLTDRMSPGEVREGAVESLRVLRGPDDREGDASAGEGTGEMLGEVPVHEDGSFYLKVPARTPLRLETRAADGATVQTMRSWIWVMPNERRGCIGCHADRERTPPNRHVLALRERPREVGTGDREPAPPVPRGPGRGYDRE
jgi:hypothetical protein